MKISGIVAEYNPFHLGHMYHIQKTKISLEDKILVIMSGNFTQRGEPALFDKWQRARMALSAGADIVIELPVIYATASSEGFAQGAISVLNGLNAIDTLSFGSEEDDLSLLQHLASLLVTEEDSYKNALEAWLGKGVSFPFARSRAIAEVYGANFSAIMGQPNTILALEYLKALKITGSTIRPYAIRRKDAGYHSEDLEGPLSSALSIRKALMRGDAAWKNSVPDSAARLFTDPVFSEALFPFILFCLRTQSKENLAKIREVTEGLENRLIEAGQIAADYASLLAGIKSKRYTMTRIKRILLNCVLGITKSMDNEILCAQPYAHVLGIKKESMDMLSYLSKKTSIPIIVSPAKYSCPSLELDIKATDIYALLKTPIEPSKRDYIKALPII